MVGVLRIRRVGGGRSKGGGRGRGAMELEGTEEIKEGVTCVKKKHYM